MSARSLFDDMNTSGPLPNVYSYSVIMSAYTHGDRLCLGDAFELLCEMEMKGVKLNAVTYGTYLYGLCRTRQVICMELSSNALSGRLSSQQLLLQCCDSWFLS